MATSEISVATAIRFWAKVDKDGPVPEHRPELGPCWLWTSGDDGDGYGKFGVTHTRSAKAHRLAFELLVGPIPEGLQLDHLCRVRRCVNPPHLEPVTLTENLRRGNVIWQQKRALTHCAKGHPFDETNTRLRPNGRRACRACQQENSRRHYLASKQPGAAS